MIEQSHAPASFKVAVSHGDTTAMIQSKDTSIYDIALIAIISMVFIFTVYMFKRGKKQ